MLTWRHALERLQQDHEIAVRDQLVTFLHEAVNKGHVDPPAFLQQIESVYRKTADVRLSAELKRMQNRIRCRRSLGRDLLQLNSPPLADSEKQALWRQLQQLKQTYGGFHGNSRNLAADYELGETIGEGAMGVVFKAVRQRDGRPVAIKLLKEEFLKQPAIRRRFERESRLCIDFEHPHVIKVLEAGAHDGHAFMVMEYMPGGSVEMRMGHTQMTLPVALQILRQTADALAYVHGQGVVHRDVKPSNILIAHWPDADQSVQIQLTDFGISKEIRVDNFTAVGAKMGTDLYVAPEQMEAPEKVDRRADIFSLGVTMYRLLSGKSYPYGDFAPLSQINPDLPVSIDDLLKHCLQTDPDKRLDSASAFDEALGGIEKEKNVLRPIDDRMGYRSNE